MKVRGRKEKMKTKEERVKEEKRGMTLIVRTVTRLMAGLIVLYSIYIILHGHLTPGGGFAGGVIFTAAFVLITLAYGKEEAFARMRESFFHFLESLGGIIFLVTALLGFIAGYFFLNLLPKGKPLALPSAGIIPVCNIGIGIKVGAGLFMVFLALVIIGFADENKGEDKK